MMQKLSVQEKDEVNWLPKEDLNCLKSGMLYTKDVNYYMDYLQEQDEIMRRKVHGHQKEHNAPYYLQMVLYGAYLLLNGT